MLRIQAATCAKGIGEAYHLAAAVILDEQFRAYCVTAPECSTHEPRVLKFMALGGPDRVEQMPKKRYFDLRIRDGNKAWSQWNATAVIARRYNQSALKEYWLGSLDRNSKGVVEAWLQGQNLSNQHKRALVWIRSGTHDYHRNLPIRAAIQIAETASAAGFEPVFVGERPHDFPVPPGAVDLLEHWRAAAFDADDSIQRQLFLFDVMRRECGVAWAIGAKAGNMDGPALLGLPTIYLEGRRDKNWRRMAQWIDVLPTFRRLRTKLLLHRQPHLRRDHLLIEEVAQLRAHLASR